MAYQLKSTGIAANCIMCIAVDPDTGTIKDFASSAVTADLLVGANVTIATQTFDGITRHYWQPGAGTTDADFVKFGTNKPSFVLNAANPNRTVVWIGQTDTAGISRFFGADASNNYFAHLNIAAGGSTHPALSAASNGYHGAQANPVNSKIICGWVLERGVARRWYTAADNAASMTTGSTALGNIAASYSLDYVDRVNSTTTHQRQKTHFLLQFSSLLTESDMDALRNDAFGTLLEVVGGGTTPVQQDFSATRGISGSVQQDFTATRSIGDGVQQDFTATRNILAAVQQDFAATRTVLGPAGVSMNVDPDHVLRNNTGSVWANTEFKLSFSRADTDAFVVNKTVTTNASGLLGVVTDAALTAGVAYDIKIKRTAAPADMGILTATAA